MFAPDRTDAAPEPENKTEDASPTYAEKKQDVQAAPGRGTTPRFQTKWPSTMNRWDER